MSEKFKVVISGVSGRFPECDSIDKFKEKLYNGDEFITVDDRKWPVGYRHKWDDEKMIPDATGKLTNIHEFDDTVFKILAGTASNLDTQLRTILEPSFEALIDAGISPYSLDGDNVAVFMSMSINEHDHFLYKKSNADNLSITGVAKTMLANRVSFYLNLKGPSVTIFVDPHGGLEALVAGFKHVSAGLTEAAIVGVVSSIFDPQISLQFSSIGFDVLCPDGITRPFDEWAKGYARSEAIIVFYLQRAEDAKRNYGELKICDSRYMGSLLPNFIRYEEENLEAILRHLLEANNFLGASSDVAFVEMNAYGHKLLDQVESEVVAKLLSKYRQNPLLVGSIKSRVGHAEAAAGFMAVLKLLFALDSGIVSPNDNVSKLNSSIRAFKEKQLQVVTEKTPLPGDTVVTNSVGLFGTVGLAVIQQNQKTPNRSHEDKGRRILLLCGRKEDDLRTKLKQIEKLPYDPNFISIANDAFSLDMPAHTFRGFTILPPSFNQIRVVEEVGERNRPIWFIFTGMGSQWNGMGRSLLNLPLFAETVAKCDRVLRQKNIDIYHILTSPDPTLFDDITNAFVGIITVQIALCEVFKALGIQPDGMIGHSVGENGCAYADGTLSLEQAVLASWARGKVSREVETVKGMMAAVGKGYAQMKDALPEGVEIACHNSANNCTLSGPAETVNNHVKKLQTEGVFVKAVNVANIAYHSKLIATLGPKLLTELKEVIPEPKLRSSKWISTSVPESNWAAYSAQYSSAEYFTNNLLSPVLFEEACRYIPSNAICIEFAPHGLLQAILKRSLPETCTNIPLLTRLRTTDTLNFLLSAIGKLYVAGLQPQVNNIFPKIEYPVPRGTHSSSFCCTWIRRNSPLPSKFGHEAMHREESLSSRYNPVCVRDGSEYAFLKDHQLDNRITIPPSFFMHLVWRMFCYKRGETLGSSSVVFEDLRFIENVHIRLQDTKYVSVMIQYGSGNFQVSLHDREDSSDFRTILTGSINESYDDMASCPQMTQHCSGNELLVMTRQQFVGIFQRAGYHLGQEFDLFNSLHRYTSEYSTAVTWTGNWVTFLDALIKVHMFAVTDENVKERVPVSVRKIMIAVSQFQSLEKGTKIPCKVNAVTNELLCSGVTMNDLKYKKLLPSKLGTRLNKFRFVSYENPRCQDVREFLHLCLQITIENYSTEVGDGDTNKLHIFDLTDAHYSKVMQHMVNEYALSDLVIILNSAKECPDENDYVWLITNTEENMEKLCTSTCKNMFVLLISSSESHNIGNMKQYFLELTKQSFSGNTFTLLKMSKKFSRNDAEESMHEKRKLPLFVIRTNIDFEDVRRLTTLTTRRRKDNSITKYLYIMDQIKDDQRLARLIREQKKLNLPVSILKDGEWGSYRNLDQKNDQECEDELDECSTLLSDISAGFPGVECTVCVHEENISDDGMAERTYNFSYAASVSESEKRIGLARMSSSGDLELDPLLSWTVPNTWRSEDAVTIPFTYAQAHRLLFSFYCPAHAKTIMINVGNEYLLAEALIVLSLYKGMDIFVVVNADEDAVLIKNRFSEIPSNRILLCENCYEFQVRKQTKMKGVDFVINCLPGNKHVVASFNCVAVRGTYVEVGDENCFESYLGLYHFLSLISFYGVRNEVSDFFKLSTTEKIVIGKFIESAIKKGVIVPPKLDVTPKKIPPRWRIMKCRRTLQMDNHSPRVMRYDSKHSYMIVARARDRSWFDLTEWLVSQGVRNFAIVLEKYTLDLHTKYLVDRLLAKQKVKILLTVSSELAERRNAALLLEKVTKFGPLEVIFFVSINMLRKEVSNLNDLVSPDVYFIGLSSGGLKEFEHRRSKGSPAMLIHSNKPLDVLTAYPNFNNLLNETTNNNAAVLYGALDLNAIKNRHMKVTNSSLKDYLPNDVETLNVIGQDDREEFVFIETGSLSRRYSQCKGVYPIFALPAIHNVTLEPLFRQLIYPVFSANVAPTISLDEAARKLYHSLLEIQPSGPVTLISETWNLALTLKLTSYLRNADRKYRILAIEGNPKNWSSCVDPSQLPRAQNCSYADEIFNFVGGVKGKRTTPAKLVSVEKQIEFYVQNISSDTKSAQNVTKAAQLINDKIFGFAEQPPVDMSGLIDNVVMLERYQPDDLEYRLSVTSEIVVINEPEYRSLLKSSKVSQIINENVEFSWWKYTGPKKSA